MTAYESTTSRLRQQELGACVLIQDLLPLYVEDEVSPGSRDIIAEHVVDCERCAGYLAGTQNALTQLRHDRLTHMTTLERDTPNRQTITGGQHMVTAIAVLTTYCGGLAASMLLWHSVSRGADDALELLLGLALGFVCLVALLALARSRSPLTLQRALALLGSCGIAMLGTIALVESGHGAALTAGLLLWGLGLGGVWVAVAQRPSIRK